MQAPLTTANSSISFGSSMPSKSYAIPLQKMHIEHPDLFNAILQQKDVNPNALMAALGSLSNKFPSALNYWENIAKILEGFPPIDNYWKNFALLVEYNYFLTGASNTYFNSFNALRMLGTIAKLDSTGYHILFTRLVTQYPWFRENYINIINVAITGANVSITIQHYVPTKYLIRAQLQK